MARENQTTRHKLLMASLEEASGFNLSGSKSFEAQLVPGTDPARYFEGVGRAFEDTSGYPTLEFPEQAPVRFDSSLAFRGFDSPEAFSVFVVKTARTSQSFAAAVEMLVSIIIGENGDGLFSSLTTEDYRRFTVARDKLIDVVGEDENHLLTPLINFIGNLIKIHDEESNPSTQTDLSSQETDVPEHVDAATLKPHRSEKVGRPATLPRLKLADLLSQETDDSEHTGIATFEPHRPEKVGRPATLPRLKLADLLSQETDDSEPEEVDMGPAVGNEVW